MPARGLLSAPAAGRLGETALLAALAVTLIAAPVKLGNPAAPAQQPVCPAGPAGWLAEPWPVETAVILGAFLGLFALGHGMGHGRVRLPSAPLALFLAFVAWEIACGASAESRPAFSTAVRYHAAIAGVWYGAEVAGTGTDRRRWLMAALLVALVYASLRGVQQRWWEIEATRRYVAVYETELFGPGGMPENLRSKLSSNRVWGTFVYPNVFAAFLITTAPATAAVAWTFLQRRAPRVALPAVVFLGTLSGIALLYTGSKAGIACALLGWSCAAAAWFRMRILRRAWPPTVIAVAAGAMAVALFAPPERLEARAATLASRGAYWRAAIRLSANHTPFGVGPGSFGIAYLRVKEPEAEEAVYAHSAPLQAAAESGVAGGILWTAAMALGWSRLLGRIRMDPAVSDSAGALPLPRFDERILTTAAAAGAGAVFLHGWFDFAWDVPGVAFPAAALLAQGGASRHLRIGAGNLRTAGVIVVAGVFLGILASGAVRIRVEAARAAEYALRGTDPALALRAGREAVRLGPGMPLAWESRARAAEAAGRPDEAAESYRKAAELEPTRARYQHHFGRIAVGIAGLEEEGRAALLRAARLYPTHPEYGAQAGREDDLGAEPRIW